ncbi:MAG: glycogen synthase GlgA [Proteobacteria bacterium]|nr:glycogen synthase GlgA [Pseudomonadota bacterium]
MTSISVLSVVSEIYPLIKTGGLADVAGSLPAFLKPEGIAITSLVPGYRAVLSKIGDAVPIHVFPDLFGGPARLLRAQVGPLDLLVIDAPHLYDRPGTPYLDPEGENWPDNAIRFAALSAVGAAIGLGEVAAYCPDVVHAHDWQAGLTPAYLHYRGNGRTRAATIMTIHNLAFQGQYPPDLLPVLGLPPEAMAVNGVEYYGGIGYLKAGLQFADRITTVSPKYAEEICTLEGGMGLGSLLRDRIGDLQGILNGIDESVWDPSEDKLIAAKFDRLHIKPRRINKLSLQRRVGLREDTDVLLMGLISRLTWQKGIDILLDALPLILGTGAQVAIIGQGERAMERAVGDAVTAYPGRVGCVIGYDEELGHLLQAGADALLLPSRFEPCGLTQLYALRYGCVPVVARVGGLSDTVIDANEMARAEGIGTGIQFHPPTVEMLESAALRVAALWKKPALWRRIQRNGMRTDVSWRRSARLYAELYRELTGAQRAVEPEALRA